MIIVGFTAHCPYGSLTDYLESSSALLREFHILHLLMVLIFFFLSYTEDKMLNIIGLKLKFWVHPCLLKCNNKVYIAVISRGTEETKTTN